MHEIAKQFDFCYGHRVWSQKLKEGFATDLCLACRHLHGHQGTIMVYLKSSHLTDGMVTDFKHLGWFKKWLDDVLDHKFIMDINDPLLPHEVHHMFDGHRELKDEMLINFDEGYSLINLDHPKLVGIFLYEPVLKEKYEGMVFVNFVPTSENLSKWLHGIIQKKMDEIDVKVSKVQFYETPKSQAIYHS
jgi:6-pyruvoyltetrahydropterin/6-carboxytetrahydropterin synthase